LLIVGRSTRLLACRLRASGAFSAILIQSLVPGLPMRGLQPSAPKTALPFQGSRRCHATLDRQRRVIRRPFHVIGLCRHGSAIA
tara:strand:+ start:3376 stop:3627 length:252 start_codon:yes stop_codon:yes gene_type:complete